MEVKIDKWDWELVDALQYFEDMKNSFDESNSFAKAIRKYKHESYFQAIISYIDIFIISKIKRFFRIRTSKRYWVNIGNAFADNDKVDMYSLSFDFHTALINRLIPDAIKIYRDFWQTKSSIVHSLDWITVDDAFEKLITIGREIQDLDENYGRYAEKVNSKDRDVFKEWMDEWRKELDSKYLEYGNLLGHLLPYMRY